MPETEPEAEVEGEQVIVPMSTDTTTAGGAKATLREQLKRSLSLSHRPEGSGESRFDWQCLGPSSSVQIWRTALRKERAKERPRRSTLR